MKQTSFLFLHLCCMDVCNRMCVLDVLKTSSRACLVEADHSPDPPMVECRVSKKDPNEQENIHDPRHLL